MIFLWFKLYDIWKLNEWYVENVALVLTDSLILMDFMGLKEGK